MSTKSLAEVLAELDRLEELSKIKAALPIMSKAMAHKLKESEHKVAQAWAKLLESPMGPVTLCALLRAMPTQGDERLEKFVNVLKDPIFEAELLLDAVAQPCIEP